MVAFSLHTRVLSLSNNAPILYKFGDHNSLFRRVPNLQHLSLSPPPTYSSIPHGFPLQSLRLDFGDFQHGPSVMLDDILLITAQNFWLPSLRKLELLKLFRNAWLTVDPHTYFPLPPTRERSCIEDIRISDYIDRNNRHVYAKIIQRILGHVKSLKRFVFNNPWQRGVLVWGDRVTEIDHPVACDISTGLESHTSTLEEIVISADDGGFGHPSSIHEYFDYKGKTFTEIRRLALPEVLFLNDFPLNGKRVFLTDKLEDLQIQYTVNVGDFRGRDRQDEGRDDRIANIKRLIGAKSNELPSLRRVIWWYQPFQCNEGEVRAGAGGPLFGSLPALQKLQGMFEQVAVKFEWTSTRLLSETPFGMRLEKEF